MGSTAASRANTPRGQRAPRPGIAGAWPIVVLVVVALLSSCAHRAAIETSMRAEPGWKERGEASWYGEPYHGRRTSSGEVYDMYALTAAHKTLPFGSVVRVTRRDTGAAVEVRINDRGPFVAGRIIDLSLAAARHIGLDVDGVAPVVVEVIGGAVVGPADGSGEECFAIQIGAFGDDERVQAAVARLENAGQPITVSPGPDGLRRVRVGPFADRERAAEVLPRVQEMYPVAMVVPCDG